MSRQDLVRWWQGLAPRERRMVSAGAAAVLLTVLWLAVVEPLQQRHSMLEQAVPTQRVLLAWLEAQELNGEAAPADPESLFAAVERSTRGTTVAGSVQRLQPEGQDSVRVWFDGAQLEALLAWLDALERERGVTPSALTFERGERDGTVDARVTLQRLP